MQNAHIIETALLLLIAFLIGCAIGWFVRTRFYGANSSESASGASPSPSPSPAAPASTEVEPATEAMSAAKKATAAKKPAAKKAEPAKKPATKKPAAAKKAPAKKAATPAAASSPAGKPAGLSAPRAGGKDDLKRISGVGPKLEEKLNDLGIFHFDQIAGWDRQTIDWVDNHLSFKGRIDRDNWVAQSKAMAAE